MKKILLFLSALLVSGNAYAAGSEVFKDSEAFVIAKAVKLGNAEGGDGGAIAIQTRGTKTSFKQCTRHVDCHSRNMKYCVDNVCIQCKSSGDCKENEKCSDNSCVPACQGVSCDSPRYQLTKNHLCICAECEGHEQCGGGETGHKCDITKYSCVACSTSEKFCCANKGTGNFVPNGKGACICPLRDDGSYCNGGSYLNSDICDCQNCAAGDDSCGFCGSNQAPDGEGGCKCVDISCPDGYHQDPNSCQCVEDGDKGGDEEDECASICGTGFVYDRPGAKNGGKERVCTYYPYSCGYACTEGWDIRYLVNGTNYTCQRALQCGDTTVVGTRVSGGKKDMTNCPKDTDDNAQCQSLCGSGFFYDRPGSKNGGKERVCTYYPQSCGYACTEAWDIRYLVNGSNYTCQRALQCGDKNVSGTRVSAGNTPDTSGCPKANDDDAQCKSLCGNSGFYYDRPGAKTASNGKQEKVCTYYPQSCGYACTTGWDIDYLVKGTEYTCQTARQTAPDNNTMCKSLCGSGFYYDRPGDKTGSNGKKEKVCTYYPLACGYSCTTGWDIDYLVQGTEYTCQTARQTAPAAETDDDKCKNICGNTGYFYDRPGSKTGANGKQEKVCTYYPRSCGYGCTASWDIRYLVNGTEFTCQRAMQCGDKTVSGTKVSAGHSVNNSGC